MTDILIIALIVLNIYLFITLKEQKRKIKVLSIFIDALINFSSKSPSISVKVAQKLIEGDELEFEKDDSFYGENLIYKELLKVLPEKYKKDFKKYKRFKEEKQIKNSVF